MKKNALFVLSLCLCCVGYSLQAQAIYEDNFDANLTMASNSAYNVSLDNGNLKIDGNGSAGAYNALQYDVHNGGTLTTFDMSAMPQLYIKARGTGAPVLRIDVKDTDGYLSNLQANYATLTENFAIYTYDFVGDFLDGGYGGSPCTSAEAPCTVNPASIANLIVFVNDAVGGYNGTVEIDWISIGEPLEEAEPTPPSIRYNQVAYHTGREKLINITAEGDFAPIAFSVFDDVGGEVLAGTTGTNQVWTESGEYVTTIDISAIDTEGNYTLVANGDTIDLTITESGYEALSDAAFKYYYFNRASTEITAAYGGAYARNSGLPDDVVIVHPSAASPTRPAGTIISAPKGWFDAGDYNKYIVNSGISTYTLLAAFEHFTSYFQGRNFDIPESTNQLPDLLDEVKWNLDWMLAMQDPEDGGVYHKLTGLNFAGIIMPEDYTADRYVVQKTTAAALNLAAVTAVAARIYADYETQLPGYSAQLLAASVNAYNWALANPTIYYQQPADVFTGEYGDNNVTDEFQWAAVELFITTGDQTYGNAINISAIGNGVPFWGYTAPLALISIAAHESDLAGAIDVNAANAKLLETVDQLKTKVNGSPMRVAMGSGDFSWGSNGQASNQLMLLLMGYQMTGDESLLSAAFTASDYLLGRNATGYCFVSGFGDTPMLNPHHRISEADAVAAPVPGMVAGGPHSGQQDGCTGYASNAPARSYVDTWCSYSTNEVTINWNAPLLYAFTALHIFQNNLILSTDDIAQNENTKELLLYPNPTTQQLNIKLADHEELQVTVYSLDGKSLLNTDLKDGVDAIDVSMLTNGLYIVKATTGNVTFVKQFIKK
ncbi:glycoside hydrolase family 9 protein [Sungkyunkwania multivorans]|uniref:Endoglucanase n=1 Tax=Sungkyunkwania multivorans TaxID=1173618 RepID=A0ABW3CWJ4_9FLAO